MHNFLIKKKLQNSILCQSICKNPKQNFSKSNSNMHKRKILSDQIRPFPGMQDWFNIQISTNVICQVNKLIKKNKTLHDQLN